MDYAFVEEESTELQRMYDVTLPSELAGELVEEIYAFLAMQAGIEYLADQSKDALEGRYGPDLAQRISVCLANQCADKIILTEGLSATLEPVVKEALPYEKAHPFSCRVLIFLKPEFELESYDPVCLPIPAFHVSPEMIERNIASVVEGRSRYVDDESVDSLEGDARAVISLRTEKSGMEVQPLTFEEIVFRMGEGFLPEQVEKGIEGMKAGETRSFSFTITSKNFLGLDVEEKMDAVAHLLRFVKKEAPEVTDAWVKQNIPGAHDTEGFRRLIEENVRAHARVDYDKLKSEAACAALAERLPDFELPDSYYDYARAGLLQNVSMALSRKGLSEEEFYLAQGLTSAQFMIQMSGRAREVVRQGLALDSLARHEGFELTEYDFDHAARAISPRDPASARKMLEMNGRVYQLREMALRNRARALLVRDAVVQSDGV